MLVADTHRPQSRSHRARLYVADWLPAFVNAGRAFVTIGAVEVFWIVTQWPNGASAIVFAAVTVILLVARADEAYAYAMRFMIGVGIATVCAAIILFAGLPNVETFAGFSMVIGLFLVPAGALMAQSWNAATFAPMTGNIVPLLAPANQMNYNTVQFYNSALAIVAGCGAAALAFRLLPPLSPRIPSATAAATDFARSTPPGRPVPSNGFRTIGKPASTVGLRHCRTQPNRCNVPSL